MSRPEELPRTLLQGGAAGEAEERAAALLRGAFGDRNDVPHPAIGARMRAGIEARLESKLAEEGGALAGLGRSRSRRLRPAGLALAGAVGVLALGLGHQILAPHVGAPGGREITDGTFMIVGGRAGTTAMRLERGAALGSDTAVSCAAQRCAVNVAGGIEASMPRDAVFSARDERRTRVHAGRVSFDVEPLAPGSTFGVHANDVLVEVIGTSFTVEVVDAHRTRVEVTKGKVRVARQGTLFYVAAGEAWDSAANRSGEPESAVVRRGPVGGAAADPDDPIVDDPAWGEAPARPATDVDDPAMGEREAAPPAESHGTEPAAAEMAPEAPSSAGAGAAAELGTGAVARPAEASSERAVPPTELLQRAADSIRRGDLDAARAIYTSLAQRRGASGELGSYLLARFELEHGAGAEVAGEILARMAESYPAGDLAMERGVTTIEVALRRGRCADAAVALRALEAKFAGSPVIAEANARMASAGCSR